MNSTSFLLDLARRRRYRGLTPTEAVREAAERVAADDSELVLQLAMVSTPKESGDRVLAEVLAELSLSDTDGVVRELEIEATLREIVGGEVELIEGGARLQQIFYEDDSSELLLPFWAAMAESDDLDRRPQLEIRLRELAEAALGQLQAGAPNA